MTIYRKDRTMANINYHDAELGKKLKEIRRRANITQEQIASDLGIDRSTYSYYESGKTKISAALLIKFCNYFNIKMDDLLCQGASADTPHVASSRKTDGENSTEKGKTILSSLSAFEKNIILNLRLMNDDDKAEVVRVINEIVDSKF